MEIEMQSGSSDFGDFEETHPRKNSDFVPRKKLWNSNSINSEPRGSVSRISKSRESENDDDFEFLITKSQTAKKIIKLNSNSFVRHNYRNSHEGYQCSYRGKMEDYRSNFENINNQNNYSKYNTSKSCERNAESTLNRRKWEEKDYNKRGHPGLERKIDFDPFMSGSNSEADLASVHEDDVYSYQNNVRHPNHDFPNQHLTPVRYSGDTVYPKRRYIILAKIKGFFKFVGFEPKIEEKLVSNYTDYYLHSKSRARLLSNQQPPGDLDTETNGEIKTGVNDFENSELNSRNISDSAFRFPVKNARRPKKRINFSRLRFRRSNKPVLKCNKTGKPIKLHSFPD
ncbi:uncharacterized protein TA11785 [Theileria annulata]|uniref:Uncharacterized protein n=1 Tax=Theileria annulata TaxID=5874 RepID=Q4UDN9_THEAN|nr:uncharacterized protein TA11785 [Theileria annulata]CAI74800.1 hypothetical protein TA11785 [Theileria annulata]|eukprot:XP_952532.1 hypothetical protein TA11785 [Theileria annulata]